MLYFDLYVPDFPSSVSCKAPVICLDLILNFDAPPRSLNYYLVYLSRHDFTCTISGTGKRNSPPPWMVVNLAEKKTRQTTKTWRPIRNFSMLSPLEARSPNLAKWDFTNLNINY